MQSSMIQIHEYFKCHLRQKSDWNTLFYEMEHDPVLHGHIQGIISKKDPDNDLFTNAKKRFNKLKDYNFTANNEIFISVLKCMELKEGDQVNITLNFSNYDSWNSRVITKHDIAEAVCQVLLDDIPQDDSQEPEWRKILLDTPELITGDDWELTNAHSLKPYYDDLMHLFKRTNISPGTIVLKRSIHEKLAEFFSVDRLDEKETEKRSVGEKTFYVCRSVECILAYGYSKIDNSCRIKFTTQGAVEEKFENSLWKVAEEGSFISWNEIDTLDNLLAKLGATERF